jgi:hypothetical protein
MMSFEVDFVSQTVFQAVNTQGYWSWDAFGSDRFYTFNVAPYSANAQRIHLDDFYWESKNQLPPGNLIAHLVISNSTSNYLFIQVIGVPSA